MTKLFNAFSLQMIKNFPCNVQFKELNTEQAKDLLKNGIESYIGHPDTARILTNLLGQEIIPRRAFGILETNEEILIAQVIGGRLPEGCTELPPGMSIKFISAKISLP